jgi:hypothetical protein
MVYWEIEWELMARYTSIKLFSPHGLLAEVFIGFTQPYGNSHKTDVTDVTLGANNGLLGN